MSLSSILVVANALRLKAGSGKDEAEARPAVPARRPEAEARRPPVAQGQPWTA